MTEKLNIKEQFLENGYKLYKQNGKEFLQKCIRDKFGEKKYFINLNIHDFRDLKTLTIKQNSNFPDFMYEADGQFTTKNDKVFNVELLDINNVESTEQFFENIFKCMNCKYYDE